MDCAPLLGARQGRRDHGRTLPPEIGVEESTVALQLPSEAVPVPVADRRSGVAEVAVSPRLADPGGVGEARVPVSALMECDARDARDLPCSVGGGADVAGENADLPVAPKTKSSPLRLVRATCSTSRVWSVFGSGTLRVRADDFGAASETRRNATAIGSDRA